MRYLIPIDLPGEKLPHVIEGCQVIVIDKPGLGLKPAHRKGDKNQKRCQGRNQRDRQKSLQ